MNNIITIHVPRIVFQNHRLINQLHATLKRSFPDHSIMFSTEARPDDQPTPHH